MNICCRCRIIDQDVFCSRLQPGIVLGIRVFRLRLALGWFLFRLVRGCPFFAEYSVCAFSTCTSVATRSRIAGLVNQSIFFSLFLYSALHNSNRSGLTRKKASCRFVNKPLLSRGAILGDLSLTVRRVCIGCTSPKGYWCDFVPPSLPFVLQPNAGVLALCCPLSPPSPCFCS